MPEGSDGAPAPANDNNTGGDGTAGAERPRGARRDRGNRNRRGHSNVPRVEKFAGKCDDLKNYVYEITSSHRTTETFMRTTREIAEYIGREFDDAGDFRTGLVEMNLPALHEPEDPAEPDNRIAVKKWEIEYGRYEKKQASRKKNAERAFALIIGQCSPAVRDLIEADATWERINTSSDVIPLLRLIRQAVVSKHKGEMRVEYCPTEEMIGDFFTKPLQGSLFRKFRALILNLPEQKLDLKSNASQECVGDKAYHGTAPRTDHQDDTSTIQITTNVIPAAVRSSSG